jgi:hypothetical protein
MAWKAFELKNTEAYERLNIYTTLCYYMSIGEAGEKENQHNNR